MPGIFAALAVMLSPKGLALAGNGAGIGGVAFIGLLLLAVFMSLRTAHSIATIPATDGKLRRWYFPFALGVLDASRLLALTVLCVSWLGLAGYAVNEFFAYWCPPLAASLVLLAIALGVCFIPNDNGKWVFGILLFVVLGAFLYISAMATQPLDAGLWYPSVPPQIIPELIPKELLLSGAEPWLNLVFLSLLACVGFDLSLKPGMQAARALPALLIMLVAFGVFMWGGLLVVPAEDLAKSTIPQFVVAETIMGDNGKLLMGFAMVFGSLAAVLATLRNLGYRFASLCKRGAMPRWRQAVAIVIAIGAAVVMISGPGGPVGIIGQDTLDALVAAGLCFWFAAYALLDLGNIVAFRKIGKLPLFSMLAFLLHGFAAGMAIHTAEFPLHMLAAVGGVLLFGLLLMFLHRQMSYINPVADAGAPYKDVDDTASGSESAPSASSASADNAAQFAASGPSDSAASYGEPPFYNDSPSASGSVQETAETVEPEQEDKPKKKFGRFSLGRKK